MLQQYTAYKICCAYSTKLALFPVQYMASTCDDSHEERHEEEPLELDDFAADEVDGGHGDPVARDGGAEGDEGGGAGAVPHLLERVDGGGVWSPPDGGEDVFLEQILGVEGDVQEEPRAGAPEELQPVPPRKLLREEPKVVH